MQLDDLRALFIFDGVSDDELQKLLAAGEEVPFHEGIGALPRRARPPTRGGCWSTGWWISCARPAARSRS